MLTKIGNLLGLQNTKQSQLNLGVIQSLAGEVFNTDNCTVIENSNGVSYRHPTGLQLCLHSLSAVASTNPEGALFSSINQRWDFPQPFSSGPSTAAVSGTTMGWANGTGQAMAFGNFKRWTIVSHNTLMPLLVLAVGKWK